MNGVQAFDLSVGPLRPDERERWGELWREYLAFYETQLPGRIFDHTWRRLMGEVPSTLFGLGARDAAGRLVGIVHALLHDTAWSDRPACYLQDLFVDPEVRGGGVGRRLIASVADAARAHDCVRLYWITHQDNATARRLYDAVAQFEGFVRYDQKL